MVRYVIGIDEAGRGALAGPVSVGAVLAPEDFDWRELYTLVTKRGSVRLRDSKQLSPQQRDILYKEIITHGRLKHAHAFVEASVIDEIGIANAAREAAAKAIASLAISPHRVEVLLDAGLSVSEKWKQQSFIRGDEHIPAIALASIIAKVSRDRFMEDLSPLYGEYHFDEHKGYGTLAHRRAIRATGLSEVHRTTFCSRLRVPEKSV
ncbi:ribonuclease HII [Candidatus Parcubacteria bacterium]|nr:MAG: ribonuclease HII [Candidatus Parcubacteria bacterium]